MHKFRQNQQSARKDFVEMEEDYSKFIDFTGVECHSDFLISPRKLKHGVKKGRITQQTQTDLIALNQTSQQIQTNVQIVARS